MEDKINQQAIVTYSQQYSGKILDRFFAEKKYISGQELLVFSEVEQVNLFVVQQLFKTWKAEIQKNRSVFFDYDAEPVQEAMSQLMNVLSRHIRVERNHLEPLVQQAVLQTLNNVLNPYDFFSKLITSNQNTFTVEAFREELKYLRLNKAPLLRLAQILQERKVETISGNEAFSILDKILEELNFTPEDIEPLLEKLSVAVPVTIDVFFESTEKPTQVAVTAASQPSPKGTDKEARTLVDDFQKINVIKESLTINQKFMFTKALFEGDFEKFSEAINALDKQSNFDGAMLYLEKHLAAWDQESEEFHEFMEMIEKRFN
jgi:hypothetical protein